MWPPRQSGSKPPKWPPFADPSGYQDPPKWPYPGHNDFSPNRSRPQLRYPQFAQRGKDKI